MFWRLVNEVSYKTFHRLYGGQYHITVPGTVGGDLDAFLGYLLRYGHTDNGGFSIDIPIQRFDGDPPVEPRDLKIRFMGLGSARRDWNFPGQASEAYPLWGPPRGVPDEFAPNVRDYIMLIKDENDGFHARYQHETADLPDTLRELVRAKESGIWEDGI